MTKLRMAESEELKKLRAQVEAAASSSGDAAKHAQELRALEDRLTKEHEEKLKFAVEAAKAEAPQAAAAPVPLDVQPAIDAALAKYKEQIKEEHAKAIEDAIDRGRKEVAARSKLKDQQLVKAQAKVKELEARLLELGNGNASASTVTPATPTTSAPPAASPVASTSASAAPATAPVATTSAAGKAALPTSLPAKPTPAPRPPNAAGRGRGAPAARGGISIRGAAPTAGRGAAAALADANAANSGAKRTREGDAVADDATAKRQKQGGGPVALRRNRVDTPTPQP